MRRKKSLVALTLAATMVLTAVPLSTPSVFKTDTAEAATKKSAYKLVWSDEFNGKKLNRKDWNVELHEPGWVNEEWQEYVDSKENIYLKNGKLYIKPIKKVTKGTVSSMIPSSNDMVGNTVVTEDQVKGNAWDVQKLYEGLKVESGKTYYVSFEASSTVPRKIQAGVQKRSDGYATYGEMNAELTTEKQTFSYTFTMNSTDDKAG